ncbi:MAG: glycosyltransferase [Dehalococcoidia bacterium]|nr:glycosyltransferase [Chloroflexota bacterium]MCK4243142.1 glycosyltransferase [Dehalococcoidia bacterium]
MKVLVVTNMYPTEEKPSFGTFVREQVESLRKEGVHVDVLFVDGGKSTLNYLWAFPRLWARLLTHRYDLIHAHYVFSGIIARGQFIDPVVLTHHGSQVFQGWQAPICRMVTPFMDRAIVVSPEMREKMGNNTVEVIPCGIDFDLFKPMPREQAREELNLPQDKKLVLWAGEYWRPIKRFDIVQKSVDLLREKDPDAELVLVGKKPLHVVPKYMNACDVLLLVSDGEGSPMVIKEAMACNLPIVSVPAGDVPEVIEGTEGCYLCSQDPQDVAEKLELALKWSKRTNGRAKIGHMEIGAISRRIISLYEELLQEKRRRGLGRLMFWQRKPEECS